MYEMSLEEWISPELRRMHMKCYGVRLDDWNNLLMLILERSITTN